ncbi:MAG: 4Fe-4S binding protein [Spirochaetales bacterium]|nr:4Fe-4S binding protein [Spirochaetales bacterium]
MKRQIIKIDETKCNGCGLCVSACHEGAIAMIDGKARLIRDDYCDGLGNCLPACPTNAITFEEREAAAYDEEAVQRHLEEQKAKTAQASFAPAGHANGLSGGMKFAPASPAHAAAHSPAPSSCGCPGSAARSLRSENAPAPAAPQNLRGPSAETAESQLRQWPVQLKLVPVNAPYFNGAHLLVAADCAAYAYASFHQDFIRNRITVIGCPKLDAGDYTEKLTAILANNDIKSLTVVRMEVPCCGGLSHAATEALKASGKFIPWQVVTVSTEGEILS